MTLVQKYRKKPRTIIHQPRPMRQLNISKQPTDPAREAESAHGFPFLQQLAVARPLGLPPVEKARLLRFLIAVAKQYRGQGAA